MFWPQRDGRHDGARPRGGRCRSRGSVRSRWSICEKRCIRSGVSPSLRSIAMARLVPMVKGRFAKKRRSGRGHSRRQTTASGWEASLAMARIKASVAWTLDSDPHNRGWCLRGGGYPGHCHRPDPPPRSFYTRCAVQFQPAICLPGLRSLLIRRGLDMLALWPSPPHFLSRNLMDVPHIGRMADRQLG